jgi:selenium metabolism protein YedF
MKTVMTLHSDRLGRGDDELGARLMESFLRKLWAAERKPDAILFYNTAVQLLAQGAPAADAVRGLAAAGVDLIACGTCIGFFKLEGKLAAGRVSTMDEIVARMTGAERVITP